MKWFVLNFVLVDPSLVLLDLYDVLFVVFEEGIPVGEVRVIDRSNRTITIVKGSVTTMRAPVPVAFRDTLPHGLLLHPLPPLRNQLRG